MGCGVVVGAVVGESVNKNEYREKNGKKKKAGVIYTFDPRQFLTKIIQIFTQNKTYGSCFSTLFWSLI